jgi:hypothetical protein
MTVRNSFLTTTSASLEQFTARNQDPEADAKRHVAESNRESASNAYAAAAVQVATAPSWNLGSASTGAAEDRGRMRTTFNVRQPEVTRFNQLQTVPFA